MENRVLVRMYNSLSYAGEIVGEYFDGEKGVLLKPCEESEVKIWIPNNEIDCIYLPNGQVRRG